MPRANAAWPGIAAHGNGTDSSEVDGDVGDVTPGMGVGRADAERRQFAAGFRTKVLRAVCWFYLELFIRATNRDCHSASAKVASQRRMQQFLAPAHILELLRPQMPQALFIRLQVAYWPGRSVFHGHATQ